MTAALLIPTVLFFVLVIAREWVILQERREWQEERRELLNRIQHPEIVPVSSEPGNIEIREPDEINLVGVVVED